MTPVEIFAEPRSIDRFLQESKEEFDSKLIGTTYSPKAMTWEMTKSLLLKLFTKVQEGKINLEKKEK